MTPSRVKPLVVAAQPEDEIFRPAPPRPPLAMRLGPADGAPAAAGLRDAGARSDRTAQSGPGPGRAGEGPRETRRQLLGETREIARPTTPVCGYRAPCFCTAALQN